MKFIYTIIKSSSNDYASADKCMPLVSYGKCCLIMQHSERPANDTIKEDIKTEASQQWMPLRSKSTCLYLLHISVQKSLFAPELRWDTIPLFQWHGYQNKEKISKRSNDNI
jgi:hypothetical protein